MRFPGHRRKNANRSRQFTFETSLSPSCYWHQSAVLSVMRSVYHRSQPSQAGSWFWLSSLSAVPVPRTEIRLRPRLVSTFYLNSCMGYLSRTCFREPDLSQASRTPWSCSWADFSRFSSLLTSSHRCFAIFSECF